MKSIESKDPISDLPLVVNTDLKEDLKDIEIKKAIILGKNMRQEIYNFLSTSFLYHKISKLSKSERNFIVSIKDGSNKKRELFISINQQKNIHSMDNDGWTFLFSFSHYYSLNIGPIK